MQAPSNEGFSEVRSEWSLADVNVLDKATGIKATFHCNSWICQHSPATLDEATSMQALNSYKVGNMGRQHSAFCSVYRESAYRVVMCVDLMARAWGVTTTLVRLLLLPIAPIRSV